MVPEHLIPVIETILPHYLDHRKIKHAENKIQAVYDSINPCHLFSDHIDLVCAYDSYGNKIRLTKALKIRDSMAVAEGYMEYIDQKTGLKAEKWVVVKYKKERLDREIYVYRKMRRMIPNYVNFWRGFRVFSFSVLVIEGLEPIGPEDNEKIMGIEILQQLYYLHTFTIHNDIKPGNIMKRKECDGTIRYFLIDFDLVATHKEDGTYVRNGWTEKWLSQSKIKFQETYPICDLFELGYTMRTIQLIKHCEPVEFDTIRNGYYGRVKKYMKYLHHLKYKKRHIKSKNYSKLMEILSQ